MCDLCRNYIWGKHHPQCPEAAEPESVGVCTECGYDIYTTNKYVQFGKMLYCWDCVMHHTVYAERMI